jgi:hypothetical protein
VLDDSFGIKRSLDLVHLKIEREKKKEIFLESLMRSEISLKKFFLSSRDFSFFDLYRIK